MTHPWLTHALGVSHWCDEGIGGSWQGIPAAPTTVGWFALTPLAARHFHRGERGGASPQAKSVHPLDLRILPRKAGDAPHLVERGKDSHTTHDCLGHKDSKTTMISRPIF
jgi:hypothetical protein